MTIRCCPHRYQIEAASPLLVKLLPALQISLKVAKVSQCHMTASASVVRSVSFH